MKKIYYFIACILFFFALQACSHKIKNHVESNSKTVPSNTNMQAPSSNEVEPLQQEIFESPRNIPNTDLPTDKKSRIK